MKLQNGSPAAASAYLNHKRRNRGLEPENDEATADLIYDWYGGYNAEDLVHIVEGVSPSGKRAALVAKNFLEGWTLSSCVLDQNERCKVPVATSKIIHSRNNSRSATIPNMSLSRGRLLRQMTDSERSWARRWRVAHKVLYKKMRVRPAISLDLKRHKVYPGMDA